MLGKDQLLSIAETTLTATKADQAEVLIWSQRSALTRFAESAIHQNMAEENVRLVVRAVVGKKNACAVTNRVGAEALKEVANRAVLLARNSTPNEEFRTLPSPQPISPVNGFSEQTAASTPDDRALAIEKVIAAARKINAIASGSFSVSAHGFAVANSLGVRAHEASTRAGLVVIIADGEASGYGEWEGKDVGALSCEAVARTAAEKCALGRNAKELPPGEYDVVLEEPAVADLISYLAYIGLGAKAFQEGRSFMCGQIGRPIAGAKTNLWDDGRDPRTLPSAFDAEGVPKQKVALIENGIARGVVYDSFTAAKEGKESTGHALPASSTFGPYPMNLCLGTGEATPAQMIESCARGLLVTRFHYTNVVSPRETILTGMTRDGTFLIENGKIAGAVKNLRFTESVLRALKQTEMSGREAKLSMGSLVPALKVKSFRFTS